VRDTLTPMSPRRLTALLLACALVASGCGSPAPSASAAASPSGAICGTAPDAPAAATWGGRADPAPTLTPVLVSNAITCGKARILFLYLDSSNRVASAPDRPATVAFYNLGRDPDKAVATAEGQFVWTIADERGMYIVDVDLPEAGVWGAEFSTTAKDSAGVERGESVRMTFSVLDTPTSVAVGQKAPPSKTPTVADVGGDVAKISTDTDPDPAFYQTSVADAVAGKEPFILVFATPKFCQTAQCGPTLDLFKPVAAAHPEVTFINVEPYKLQEVDGQLQPVLDANKQLVAADSTTEWGLLAEPWIFAVDRDGVVRGSYELTISPSELDAIIPVITAGA
jgi:hypothetical protein